MKLITGVNPVSKFNVKSIKSSGFITCFKLRFKLKQVGLTGLFLFGVVCIYLGFSSFSWFGINQPDNYPSSESGAIKVGAEEKASPFFVNFRHEREVNRQQQRDLLNDLINNTAVAAETRKAAQLQMLQLSKSFAMEADMENQILAKGFRDTVSSINNDTVTLTVYGEKFTSSEITRLQDIAIRVTGMKLENIVIVPRL